MRSILIALVLATGVVPPSAANIIQVPSVHATIQAGINAAVSGDTVQVGPGTYTGPSNRNLDFAGKNILLRSSAGAATTIIDCQNLARGMRFHTGETAAAIVQGFTIRNGLASGTFGGGILVESGARPTIRNCRFQSNHANTGGGVFVSSAVTLTDCDFEENSADNHGGGAYGEAASLQATRCSFTQNTAAFGAGVSFNLATGSLIDCTLAENTPANQGGGVYAASSNITMIRCSFVGNTGKHGPGAYLLAGTATADSCTFTTNIANYSGGGVHAIDVAPIVMRGCTFERNETLTYNFQFDNGGGGLYIEDTTAITGSQVIDCVFRENVARGDANEGTGGGVRSRSDALILRCTFIDNHAVRNGGGIQCTSSVLQGCVFEGNTSQDAGGADSPNGMVDCRFTDNHALRFGGACNSPSGEIVRCEFSGNSAGNRAGAIYANSFGDLTIEDCQFNDNYASTGGAMWFYLNNPAATKSITGCTFVGNTAAAGGAITFTSNNFGPVTISECTFVANDSPLGNALNLAAPVEISNTIIAFGAQGEAVTCGGSGIGVMSCTDIFGNAGGDWTACISDQLGINGNFSLDPRFCNRAGRDFTLAQTSPCTAANAPAGCGLIGAHPVACAFPIGIADAGAPAVTPVLRVTPNPMRGAGMIEWAGVGGRETELRLYDVAGRIVARRMESGAGGELPWSTLVGASGVPSGVYFLEVGDRGARVRLVVVR